MHDDYARTMHQYTRRVRAACLFALSACLAACAGTTMSHTARIYTCAIDPPDRSGSPYYVLGNDEIRARPFQTAYDAVSKLRPRYLTARHADHDLLSLVAPVVVIEGGLPEPIDVLRRIAADDVAEIRFIEAADAVTKFGARYSGGVVTVRLTNQGRLRPPL